MNQEILVAEQPQELVQVVSETGVSTARANQLWEKFQPFYQRFQEVIETAESACIEGMPTDDQVKVAKETRLKLVKIRTEFNKSREEEKKQSLLEGRAIQGFFNIYLLSSNDLEGRLKNVEDYHKRIKEEKEARITAERNEKIAPYAEYIPQGVFPGKMTEEGFNELFELCKHKSQKAIEEERRLEEERIEQKKKEAEEREAQRKENERLKKEAAEREKQREKERQEEEVKRKAVEEKARKEREAQEAKLAAERKEREKAEAELKAKQEAEEAERKAKEEAERKAKAAPDKQKLLELARAIDRHYFPELKTPEANKILSDVKALLVKVSNHIREKSAKL